MWMKEFCTTQPDALISSATMEIGIEFLLEYQASSIDIAESLNMGLLSTMLAHANPKPFALLMSFSLTIMSI